jgi:photosystem II stability/assembly factor-like uncharacterized protein
MAICLAPNGQAVYEGQQKPDHVLIGTVDGVVTLRLEPGIGWQLGSRALHGLHVSSFAHNRKSDIILAGTHGNSVHLSRDGGRSWQPKANGIPHDNVYCVAIHERDGQTVFYAGTEPARLYQSTDEGESWSELPSLRDVPLVETWTFPAPPHEAHVKNVTFDHRDPSVIFASVEQGALLKSNDGGRSWRELAEYSKPEDRAYKDIHRLVVRPSNPDVMFISGGEGLYRSDDGGETWRHLSDRSARIGYPDALLISPLDNDVMFMAGAATDPGHWPETRDAKSCIMRSNDGGRTWAVIDNNVTESLRSNIEAMSLHAYPDGFSIFAGTTEGEIFASEDEGESWSMIASGLPAVSKSGHYRQLSIAR